MGVKDKTKAAQKEVPEIVNNQFAKLFNSYAQAINRQGDRTGALFEHPFRRIPVADIAYLQQMIYYIHYNPQKHGFITDFRDYSFSSYRSFISEGVTRLPREEVFSWFGGKPAFLVFHNETRPFDQKWEEEHDF